MHILVDPNPLRQSGLCFCRLDADAHRLTSTKVFANSTNFQTLNMPVPLYVLASHGISEDRDNNLVTVFLIIESLALRRHTGVPVEQVIPDVAPMTSGLIRAISVWVAEDGDIGVEF